MYKGLGRASFGVLEWERRDVSSEIRCNPDLLWIYNNFNFNAFAFDILWFVANLLICCKPYDFFTFTPMAPNISVRL